MATYGLLALSSAVSALTYKHIWIDPSSTSSWSLSSFKSSVPSVLDGCGKIIPLLSFKENNIVTILRELICIRTSFIRLLFSQKIGFGAFLIFISLFIPFFIRLSYHSASPNNQSFLQGPILPTLTVLLASVDVLMIGNGFALFLPTLIAILYTVGAPSRTGKLASLPLLPCPSQAIYGANLSAIFLGCFFIGTIIYDEDLVSSEFWWEQFVPVQVLQFTSVLKGIDESLSNFFPVIVLPVLLLGYTYVQRINSEEDAKKQLEYYRASEVAYGFERTWAYYRQTGLLSFLAYLYGLSQIVRGIFGMKETPNAQSQYILLLSLQILIAFLTITIVDHQSAPDDGLEEEALKAIQRAPAGNPGLEDNPKALALLGLFTGPSMAFMLWHGHTEEIRGWKGRRAWRLNSSK